MAALQDIAIRTAARLGMDAHQLQPYVDALLAIVLEARQQGDEVELMTFGILRDDPDGEAFLPHASLLPPDGEEQL